MKLPHLEHKKKKIRDPKRFNPHHYWVWLLCASLLVLTAELVFFSWYFMNMAKTLDEPALPTLQTNSSQINRMKARLETVEDAINGRTGEINTSQNEVQMVE